MTDKARIDGSKWAEEVAAYAAEQTDPDYAFGFYRTMARLLPREHRPVPQTTLRPMSDQESRAFGNIPCPYRKWEGLRIDDVERPYLDFIAEAGRKLGRYLASRHREAVDRAVGGEV